MSGKTSKPIESDQNHNPFGDVDNLSDTASESSDDSITGRKKRRNKRLCRKRNRSAQLYEEVKQWTKNPRIPDIPEPPQKSKEEIRLEKLVKKAKEGEKEWNDFVMQEEMSEMMYVDRSLRGDPKKDALMKELDFTKCKKYLHIKKSKFFIGITERKKKFISLY